MALDLTLTLDADAARRLTKLCTKSGLGTQSAVAVRALEIMEALSDLKHQGYDELTASGPDLDDVGLTDWKDGL